MSPYDEYRQTDMWGGIHRRGGPSATVLCLAAVVCVTFGSAAAARSAGAGATSSPHRLQELRLPLPRDKVLKLDDQEPHLKALRRRLQLEAAGLDPDSAEAAASKPAASSAAAARRAKREAAEAAEFCTSLDGPVCPLPATSDVGRRNPWSSSSTDDDDGAAAAASAAEVVYGADDSPIGDSTDDDSGLTKAERVERALQRQMKKIQEAKERLDSARAKSNAILTKAREDANAKAAAAAANGESGDDAKSNKHLKIDMSHLAEVFDDEEESEQNKKKKKKKKKKNNGGKGTEGEGGDADGPWGEGSAQSSGGAGAVVNHLDAAILEAAVDIRCDVCRALARDVFVHTSEMTRGGTAEITEEGIFKRAHRSCTGQVPQLLHQYAVVPRPNAEADSLDDGGGRGGKGKRIAAAAAAAAADDASAVSARFVLAERDGHTTLTNFEAGSFKKACVAVVQEVDDELAERTYVAVRERWADVAKFPAGSKKAAAAVKAARAKKSAVKAMGAAARLDIPGDEGGDDDDGKGGKKEKASEAAQKRNHILFKLQSTVCDKNPAVCPAGGSGGAAALLSTAKSKKRKPPAVEELLRKSGSRGKGCVYTNAGWWTYEVCYGETITQYHVDHPDVSDSVSLGVFDEEATAAAMEARVPFLDPQDMLPAGRPSIHAYINPRAPPRCEPPSAPSHLVCCVCLTSHLSPPLSGV